QHKRHAGCKEAPIITRSNPGSKLGRQFAMHSRIVDTGLFKEVALFHDAGSATAPAITLPEVLMKKAPAVSGLECAADRVLKLRKEFLGPVPQICGICWRQTFGMQHAYKFLLIR